MKKIASLLMGTACVAGSFLALAACSSPYEVASMDRSRLVVDARYDVRPDAEAMAFIAPYQREVDSLMFPVVGETTHQMATGRPESDLSNLLADIMVWAGTDFGEQPQLGVYNMGGIRANLPAGKVTKGDILNVAPFENKICFLTLTGEDLLLLFREIAHRGGEGVSHGVELTITKDGQLIAGPAPRSGDRSSGPLPYSHARLCGAGQRPALGFQAQDRRPRAGRKGERQSFRHRALFPGEGQ